jgi:hypothetical protein
MLFIENVLMHSASLTKKKGLTVCPGWHIMNRVVSVAFLLPFLNLQLSKYPIKIKDLFRDRA